MIEFGWKLDVNEKTLFKFIIPKSLDTWRASISIFIHCRNDLKSQLKSQIQALCIKLWIVCVHQSYENQNENIHFANTIYMFKSLYANEIFFIIFKISISTSFLYFSVVVGTKKKIFEINQMESTELRRKLFSNIIFKSIVVMEFLCSLLFKLFHLRI